MAKMSAAHMKGSKGHSHGGEGVEKLKCNAHTTRHKMGHQHHAVKHAMSYGSTHSHK